MSRHLFCLTVLTLITGAVRAQFRFPEGEYHTGSLRYVNGLPVLRLSGTPEQLGEQAAYLVAKPAARLLRFPEELLSSLATPTGAKLILPGIKKTGLQLFNNAPAAYRAEAESVLKHSHIDRETFILGNTAFDQKHLVMPLFGCSAVIVEKNRSSTGETILARNMDYMGLGYLHEYTIVTVVKQPGKKSFVAIGYPGTLGVISGMNEAGLAIASLETTGAPKEAGPAFDPQGVPFLLNYRQILEDCGTVEEAHQLLSRMKRTTAQHLAVCDKTTGAILEYTPSKVVMRRPESGTCRCANHFISSELKLPQPKNLFTTLDRLSKLDAACTGSHPIGIGELKQYLNQVHQNDMTLQSMVFEPSRGRIHLAVGTGKQPASSQEYRVVEMAELLR
jgi:isopenicillin-N N-acyltransferase-like protein